MHFRKVLQVLTVAALALGTVALLPSPADAAWRRVTRNVETGGFDDVAVCTDGIHVVLGTRLSLPPEAEAPVDMPREAFLVTTDLVDTITPAGETLLELPRDVAVRAPKVSADDPRLPFPGQEPFDHHYLVEETHRWSRPVAPGTTVHFWLRFPGVGSTDWVGGTGWSAVVAPDGSEGCPVFGEPAPEVALDPNVLSARDEIGPQIPNLTIFSVSGAALVPGSVRFGAPGREAAPALTLAVGDTVYGLADLRGRGLGCAATTASVTATTTDGQAVAATARVRPVCVRWLPW